MMIHPGVPQVGEREALQQPHRLVGAAGAGADLVEQ
jgi:hypothetical protein